MPELSTMQPEKDAGYVNMSSARAKRKAKMEQEEREIAALMEGSNVDDPTEKEIEPESSENEAPENLEKTAEPENSEERTFKKRYGDLRRHSQAREKELLDKIKKLEEGQSGGSAPPKSEEELKQWMTKYPEVGAIVRSIAIQEASKLTSDTAERLRLIEEKEYDLKVAKVEDTIRKTHPDLDKLMDSDAFHDWAESQSKWIQDALYENEPDAKAVISVINLYKEEVGLKETSQKQRQRDAARMVDTKTQAEPVAKEKPTYSESQIQRNSDAWYEKHESAIYDAIRDGRFVYDVSGGAR